MSLQKIESKSDRRKTNWDLRLNHFVTLFVVIFCVGILLVWIGMFENQVNPGDGVVSSFIGNLAGHIKNFADSFK